MRKPLVLGHRSWHGGWAWDAVMRHLSAEGYQAYAATLPDQGPGATRLGITHQDCVRAVVGLHSGARPRGDQSCWVESWRMGHSKGGGAALGPDRADNVPTEYTVLFNSLAAASSDNTMLIPWEIWRDDFVQDAPESTKSCLRDRRNWQPTHQSQCALKHAASQSRRPQRGEIQCPTGHSLGFVPAAPALGATPARVAARHLVPLTAGVRPIPRRRLR